ncbi:MAG TPA: cation diffusion facilitator family transporter [Methylibium sp.]
MQVSNYLKLSVVAAIVTIVLKTAAWWVTDSVGLLSDALESFVNLAGAVFALAMVTISQRPADDDHPYGHHKAEYFSSGFEGVLIFGAAVAIIWAAAQRFFEPQPLQSLGLGLVLAIISTIVNGVLGFGMLRTAKAHRSIALEADARHLFADVWTTVGVVLGLTVVHFTGLLWLDALVGIGVALNILREGVSLVWRSVEGLMDHAVEPAVREQIDRALQPYAQPPVRFDHVVTRRAGRRRFVDLHMHVPAAWSLGQAAALRASVEQALMSAVPGLRPSIQLLPTDVEAKFVADEEDERVQAS